MTRPSQRQRRNRSPSPRRRSLRRFRSAFSTVSVRLFLLLAGITSAAFAAYAYFSVRTTAEHWRDTVTKGAQRSSSVINNSTHYSMLRNRKEEVHQIIRTIAEAPGVAGVSIYDKNGVIIFSADAAEIGQQVDLQAEACVICHDQAQPLRSVPTASRVRVYRDAQGASLLGLINPIVNKPECSNADCHAHPPEQTILGVLDVKMSMAGADADLAATTRRIIAAAIVTTLGLGLFSAAFINLVVQRPVKQLIRGIEKVASGDLEAEIAVVDRSELGQLARAFNEMTRDLRRAREENLRWSQTLEQKIVDKTEELSRTQRQVDHMEKMASLGKLAATVAHELNNPLSGILSYARLVARDLESGDGSPEQVKEDARYLGIICKEADRCGEIVRNLLLFSRQTPSRFALQSLNAIVKQALMLVRHHLEISGMQLDVHLLEGDDRIVCDSDQIKQALIALFVNAVEAKGNDDTSLRVAIESAARAGDGDGEWVRLIVSDTGVGIPPERLPQIFEPFFSTKDHTSGVGLGLSVVYGIVQRHGGTIEVGSEEGRGTKFDILLPRYPPPSEEPTSPE